jgi:hypothetical protein
MSRSKDLICPVVERPDTPQTCDNWVPRVAHEVQPDYLSEVWEALDRAISESGKNRAQIVAHREFQSTEVQYARQKKR